MLLYYNLIIQLQIKMKLKYSKLEEKQMVRFLRFRKEDPRKTKLSFMALKDIAALLNKSVAYVAWICKELKTKRIDAIASSVVNQDQQQQQERRDVAGSERKSYFDKYRREPKKHFTEE